MRESGYYPPGAEFDPNAPYNQVDPDPVEKEIDYSCVMHRNAIVATTNYIPGGYEKDEDDFAYSVGDDFSDTDWLDDFHEEYRTPLQLIELLREVAGQLKDGKLPDKSPGFWKDVIDDCENWDIDDEDTDFA